MNKNAPKPPDPYAVYSTPMLIRLPEPLEMWIVQRLPVEDPQKIDLVALFEKRDDAEAFVTLRNRLGKERP